jgi:hypothetical protein
MFHWALACEPVRWCVPDGLLCQQQQQQRSAALVVTRSQLYQHSKVGWDLHGSQLVTLQLYKYTYKMRLQLPWSSFSKLQKLQLDQVHVSVLSGTENSSQQGPSTQAALSTSSTEALCRPLLPNLW